MRESTTRLPPNILSQRIVSAYVVYSWLFRGPHLLGKTVFGPFPWLFHDPHFGQSLSVLALEQSSDKWALPLVFQRPQEVTFEDQVRRHSRKDS